MSSDVWLSASTLRSPPVNAGLALVPDPGLESIFDSIVRTSRPEFLFRDGSLISKSDVSRISACPGEQAFALEALGLFELGTSNHGG